MLPHIIVYTLYVAVLFMYTKKTQTLLSRLPRWAGNPMTAGAQQPISAIAAGDSAVTPPSILDNQTRTRPALRKRCRVWQ